MTDNDLPPRLKALDEKRGALDAMMLSTLDGYVAGSILCAEMEVRKTTWVQRLP